MINSISTGSSFEPRSVEPVGGSEVEPVAFASAERSSNIGFAMKKEDAEAIVLGNSIIVFSSIEDRKKIFYDRNLQINIRRFAFAFGLIYEFLS